MTLRQEVKLRCFVANAPSESMRGRDIVPGVAFRGSQASQSGTARSPEEDGAEAEVAQVIPLPEGISHRVRNLFLLNLDLRSELGAWLTGPTDTNGGAL
jgi:hypothetical protein